MCLGDRTGEDHSKVALSNHRKAAKILRKLVYRIRAFDSKLRSNVLNEYYWFSKQPRKQYRLGVKDVRSGNSTGYYSMGVGGWCVARNYVHQGKFGLARVWAKRSSSAWERYFEYKCNYYHAWTWYARSQGFLHGEKAMEATLKMAQKLSKQKKNYVDFVEVRREFKKLGGLK